MEADASQSEIGGYLTPCPLGDSDVLTLVGSGVAYLGPGPGQPLTTACPMQVWCRCITTIFNYFVVTNFFWMFAEGCYLHTAIVMTYSTERLRKWLFLFIGWCEVP